MAIDLWRTRPYSGYNSQLRQWVDRVFDDAFAREGTTGTSQAGFQSLPVDWTISSARKRAFFGLLKEITGA